MLVEGYGGTGGTNDEKKKRPTFSAGASASSGASLGSSLPTVGSSAPSPVQARSPFLPVVSAVQGITPVESSIDLDYEEELKTKEIGAQSLMRQLTAPKPFKPNAAARRLQTKDSTSGPAAVGPETLQIRSRSNIFTPDQIANAKVIAQVGNKMGMNKREIITGLMTAMQESNLTNVNYGDRDSLGLFQQRPSMGWGSPEQVTNPQYAASKFFEGLQGVDNHNKMPLTMAAQSVQRSAYPDAYAKWEDEARSLVMQRPAHEQHKPMHFFKGLNGLVMPVQGMGMSDITSDFGPRIHPISGRSSTHTGVDYGMPEGTPVMAPQNAVVQGVNPGDAAYGNQVILGHGRDVQTMYGHLSGFAKGLDVGEKIKKGEVLGYIGSTGYSTGPHLHWETWLGGTPVNPVDFVAGKIKGNPGVGRPVAPSPGGQSAPVAISGGSSGTSMPSSGGGNSGLSAMFQALLTQVPGTASMMEFNPSLPSYVGTTANSTGSSEEAPDQQAMIEMLLKLVEDAGVR